MIESFFSEVGKAFSEMGRPIAQLVPKLIVAAIIVFVGWLIALGLKALINRALHGLNRLAVKRFSITEGFEYSIRIITTLTFWLVFFMFIAIATERLGMTILADWLAKLTQYLPKILAAILVGVFGWHLSLFLKDLVFKAAQKASIAYASILANLTKWLVLLVSVFIALEQIKIDISLLNNLIVLMVGVLMGGLGLAIAMGSKQIVSNILSSYHLQKRYSIGQRVRIESWEGEILQITATQVIVKSADGEVSIPAVKFVESASVLIEG